MRCRRALEIESGNDISLSEQDSSSAASDLVNEKKDACRLGKLNFMNKMHVAKC